MVVCCLSDCAVHASFIVRIRLEPRMPAQRGEQEGALDAVGCSVRSATARSSRSIRIQQSTMSRCCGVQLGAFVLLFAVRTLAYGSEGAVHQSHRLCMKLVLFRGQRVPSEPPNVL